MTIDNSNSDGAKTPDDGDDALKAELNSLLNNVRAEQAKSGGGANNALNPFGIPGMPGAGAGDGNVGDILESLSKSLPPQFQSAFSQIINASKNEDPNFIPNNAITIARRIVGAAGDNPILASTVKKYSDEVKKVNLWIDTWTSFEPNREAQVRIIRPVDWIDQTAKEFVKYGSPHIDMMTAASIKQFKGVTDDLKDMTGEESAELKAQMAFNIPGIGGAALPFSSAEEFEKLISSFNRQGLAEHVARFMAETSSKVFSGSDFGLDLFKEDYVFIPQNIETFIKNDNSPFGYETYIVMREVMFTRFFHNVHWVSPYIYSLVRKALESGELEMPDLTDLTEGELNEDGSPNLEGAIAKMQMKKPGEMIKLTQNQRDILLDLQTILALVEAWVDYMAFRAGSIYLDDISKIPEHHLRRRYNGACGDKILSKIVGVELNANLYPAAYNFWEKYAVHKKEDGALDDIWRHIDYLPKRLDEKSVTNFLNGWKDDTDGHDWNSLFN